MEAFSDGVIAIVITIMVLEFKIPHGDSLDALRPLFHTFVSYVLSFIYVGIYWNNPVILYGFVLLMCGAAYSILVRQLIHIEGRASILAKAMGRDMKGWISVIAYILAIGLSFVNSWISYSIYIVVAIMWLVPDRRIERQMKLAGAVLIVSFLGLSTAHAKDITTNEVVIDHGPDWLTQTRVEKVTDRIQRKLEWTIRKINVHYYSNDLEFQKSHSLGPNAIAVTTGQGNKVTMYLGPLVTNAEFDEVFGHELTHVIVLQKYKGAIPSWFEEGLANHYGGHAKVDYKWLARQTAVADVKTLAHPMRGSVNDIRYRYKASQALAEMLDKKCDLENLIRLSVQRKMEDYIVTYCEIPDLNVAFKAWVAKQAAAK
ncbi:hypothetical protein BH10BDE1_BH10BDE1_16090 [soil metagenome]